RFLCEPWRPSAEGAIHQNLCSGRWLIRRDQQPQWIPQALCGPASVANLRCNKGKNMRNALLILLAAGAPALAEEPLITRLGGVTFTVASLDKARQFYTELLGLDEAFDIKDASGKVQGAFFKVNDEQFLEFSPGEVVNFRLDRVTLLTSDLTATAAALKKQGI